MISSKKTITVEKEVTERLSCDNCGCDIPLAFGNPDELTVQGKNALHIIFDGGYGMYVDPIGESPDEYHFLFCGDCSDKLCDQYACFKKHGRGKALSAAPERPTTSTTDVG